MLGTINSLVRGEVTIHTYTSPESGLEANTHIVELPTQLLVIDTQYAVPFAAEAAAYAATLGKPITRVYVTYMSRTPTLTTSSVPPSSPPLFTRWPPRRAPSRRTGRRS